MSGPRSVPTAPTWCSCPSAIGIRWTCSWPTPGPDASERKLVTAAATRGSTACSSSTPPAPGTTPASSSRLPRFAGRADPHDPVDARRRRRARARLSRSRSDLRPELLADRNPDRVFRPERRHHRPLRLRSGNSGAAPPDRRWVRGPAAGLVARWPNACVHDRSVHVVARGADVRRLSARRVRSRVRGASRAAVDRRREEHRSAVDRERSTVHRRCRQRQQRVQARHGRRRRPPADERAERRHRHHRAQPGAIRRSRSRTVSPTASTAMAATRSARLPISSGAIYAKALSTPARNVRWRHRSGADAGRAVVSDRPLSRRPLVEQHRTAVSVGGLRARWAAFFRAGMSVTFSDLLEQRQLQTAVQVGTSARDFAVQTAYVNRQSRWTWGMLGGQLPVTFLSARTYRLRDSSTIERDTEELRQTHRQGMMMAAYPFSRAQRIELTAAAPTAFRSPATCAPRPTRARTAP